MNINLKQPEIEAALRQYIGRKLDLRNSTLAIVFNMGRGDNGLSANLTIEDVNIPGFTDTACVIEAAEDVKAIPATVVAEASVVQASKNITKAADPEILLGGGAVGEAIYTAGTGTVVEGTTVATAAIATPETEAAKAEPVAEAKTADAPAPAKASTSLFG